MRELQYWNLSPRNEGGNRFTARAELVLATLVLLLGLGGCNPTSRATESVEGVRPRIAELGGQIAVEEGAVRINLDKSKVTDDDLVRIGALENLRILTLHHTGITDVGLSSLQQATGLQSLDLANTQVSDAGLAYLRNLNSLKCLVLNGCDVTELAVQELRTALPNTFIVTNAPWAQDQHDRK